MSVHIARLRAAVAGIRLRGLLGVIGGPDYEVTYPNGDRAPTSRRSAKPKSSAAFPLSLTANFAASHGSVRRTWPR
jgi:hypothetical protein